MSEILKKYLAENQKNLVHNNRPGYASGMELKTAGDIFINSEEFKSWLKSETTSSGNIEISRKALTTSNNLGETTYRNNIIGGYGYRIAIRDLMQIIPTDTNSITYMAENTFVNNADRQVNEGDEKKESEISFIEVENKIITLAHFVNVSRQAILDLPNLKQFIDARLIGGLLRKEEQMLLYGTQLTSGLDGLMVKTGVNDLGVMTGTSINMVDWIVRACTQVALSGGTPTAVILHPSDYEKLILLKNAQGDYILFDDKIPVQMVQSVSMVEGSFIVGDFDRGCAIYEREAVNSRISDQSGSNFTRNMFTILVENRLTMPIFAPSFFTKGAFA